jgi:hypothetical protein
MITYLPLVFRNIRQRYRNPQVKQEETFVGPEVGSATKIIGSIAQ